MTMDTVLTAIGVLGAVVASLSARIRRLPVSEPLMGLLIGILLGRQVSGLLPLPTLLDDHALIHEATRLLLAVSVMSVALRYPIAEARKQRRPVFILLLVAMPAMAFVTAGLTWALLGVSVAAAALLGAAVCPTDPVLASSVVTGEPAEHDLPARDRQVLSLESGANDGLALPFVLVAIALAGPLTGTDALLESVWQVLAAIVVGVSAGWLAAHALRIGEEHGATDTEPALLFTLLLALGVLGAAGLLKADGILAVFAAGLAFNYASTRGDRAGAVSIDEAINRFAVLPVFLLFGAMLPWEVWADLGWQGPALAVAVLVLRRVPLLLLIRRTLKMERPDALYLGWFGPVGVSALFYLTLEADRLGVDPVVLGAGALVVAASTVAHGVTSAPGRLLYRRAAHEPRS
ncbi:sodium:proton exchanger [Phytoactinopolyspora alkaliphila]|uniref:Sodium:proton exchanger n=1 Tax=Phytoactinopolyspora alkaliphila TaxID=1783498 RepID=A0A6N9YQD7_9ACTN|nr:cation:proton antiporter [Phytoactinopolyspora alkaliphila]NED97039.1 sodium:proton exchanger [Phytoactinopolyspora alkaliphila]